MSDQNTVAGLETTAEGRGHLYGETQARSYIHDEETADEVMAVLRDFNKLLALLSSPASGEVEGLVARLEVAPTVILPDMGNRTIDVATRIRQMMVERAEAATALRSLAAEWDEALSRVDDLELEGERVAQEFEGECWKAMRRLLNECHFDWSGTDTDGVTAADAELHIKETLDALAADNARLSTDYEICSTSLHDTAKYLEAAEAEAARLRGKVEEAITILRIIAGELPPFDYLMGNSDMAKAFLAALTDKQEEKT